MAEAMNYPGNSHKSRAQAQPAAPSAPKKDIQQVTSKPATQVKPSLGRRVKEQFSGDDAHGVGGYVLFEVLIPAAKSTIADAVSQGIERLLFGEARPRSGGGRPAFTPYGQFSKPATVHNNARTVTPRSRAVHDFQDILLPNRQEAEEVIDKLYELTQVYDAATVNDLYSMVGITGQFTDDNWGWTDLRTAKARAVRDGYILDLPRPVPLNTVG